VPFAKVWARPAISKAKTSRSSIAGPNQYDRLPELAAQLVRRQAAVIAATGGEPSPLARRMSICEEKSSGIDRVVHQAEVFQLPAPDFRAGHRRTVAAVYGPKSFDEMDREDRVRACYQHCALRWVVSARMTNQSLRERFGLPESKAAVTSQVIAATIEAGLIKPDEAVGGSRKYARYLPFWA
jgi:predicted HTH transcriptional regulator